jgi:hypothetical protein
MDKFQKPSNSEMEICPLFGLDFERVADEHATGTAWLFSSTAIKDGSFCFKKGHIIICKLRGY